MSDDEERVTMPFKFVTAGTYLHRPLNSITAAQSASPTPETPLSMGSVATEQGLMVTGFDARFPNQNQTKHCWQNYVDYYKCINAKGEDFKPCRQFYLAYKSLCPASWCNRWDDQRENGTFPASLEG